MANKANAATARGKATEPVDYSQIPQESDVAKPTKEELAKSGYALPEHFDALEQAGGDAEQAAKILAESSDALTTLDEVNAAADKVQAEAMQRAGRTYTVLGQKNAGGPAENKSATSADAEEETATRTRSRSRK